MLSDSLDRRLGALVVESGACEDLQHSRHTLSSPPHKVLHAPFPLISLEVELGVARAFRSQMVE